MTDCSFEYKWPDFGIMQVSIMMDVREILNSF